MAGTFLIRVRAEFSGAHQLHGYDGPCARMHGHNWIVEVEIAASALDGIGMGVDFRAVRGALSEITGEMEHQTLNDLPPFRDVNPTAEHVAAHVHRRMAAWIAGLPPAGRDRLTLRGVTIWENARSSVRYEEP